MNIFHSISSLFNNIRSKMSKKHAKSNDIDESLYSRQLYVLGHEAMRRMAKSDILISGMGGLGVEIAKNVILGGVRSVTVHDQSNCVVSDLSSQYFLTNGDIGKNRAEACVKLLSELNPYVKVTSFTKPLDKDLIKKFTVVVLTDSTLSEQLKVSKFARSKHINLIIASTKGLFGQIFCDFGDKFEVLDTNGEQTLSIQIESVTKDKDGVVTTDEERRHRFETGDYVTFKEVKGMVELNNCKPRKIKVLAKDKFSIGDTSKYGTYIKGGIASQVKMPKTLQFKSLSDSLKSPEFVISIASAEKFDYPQQLHLAFQACDRFFQRNNRFPHPWSKKDAQIFLKIVNEIVSEQKLKLKIDEKLMNLFSYLSGGDVSPLNAVIGGIAAQEVMKACSGKFTPIHQWLYFDAIECLPIDIKQYPNENTSRPTNSRYDRQIAIFGQEFQQKLANSKYFIVGSGAIGCELLKNLTMMGIASSRKGKIWVTDMDIIEKSNLNRQFLFRSGDVGKPKSDTAAAAVKKMNPSINIIAHQNRVGVETEKVYDDKFFANLYGVMNALDNVDARAYMDRRCVYHRKPLIDTGTMGTKGNVQVVLPFLTESYTSSQDPSDDPSIPMCTLRNFPYVIEHTLEWARDEFEGLFKQNAENAYQYLNDPIFMTKTLKRSGNEPIEVLESVKKVLVDERPKTFEHCVEWARNHFELQYNHQIQELCSKFPVDCKTSSGALFWSGAKRFPHALNFNSDNALHFDYIVSASNLRAYVYNIPQCRDRKLIKSYLSIIKVAKFTPKSDTTIPVNKGELENTGKSGATDIDSLKQLQKQIPKPNTFKNITIKPIEFEKDDDSNYHMDFIMSASNLRAENYDIPPADRHKSKLIAGKIIPAIATTTSLIAGLACLELYKLVQKHNKLEPFKNSFVNLALPFFGFTEPIAAPKQKYFDKQFTLWDRFEIEGRLTLKQFLDHFHKSYKLKIIMLSYEQFLLFSDFMRPEINKQRMNIQLTDIIKTVTKRNIDPWIRSVEFVLNCTDDKDNDVDVPNVKYTIPTA